jgi:alpha-beta hydrolase superfamily lysophospholipase
MKENAQAASASKAGGARFAAGRIAQLVRQDPSVELHLVAHSAGAVLHADFLQALTLPKSKGGQGLKIKTCTLWAPACNLELFQQTYAPAVQSGALEKFALFTLSDAVEQDDHCAHIYHKSLLYLVSNAFEAKPRIPLFRDGVPLLGMAKFVSAWSGARAFFGSGKAEWIKAPNSQTMGDKDASRALSHAGFDDDEATVKATLARVLGKASFETAHVQFKSGPSRQTELRQTLSRLAERRPGL